MFDHIVIGLGATGSAAVYQLARRGSRVLGIDRFDPPHECGSSHGESRITRLALGEGAQYVPLVRRSHEIWRELEAATGEALLRQCGGLFFGATHAGSEIHGVADFLQSTIDVARAHDIGHELLDAAALEKRFPQFHFDRDDRGYFEPEAGYVRPEACLRAQLSEARRMGASIHAGEQLTGWRERATGIDLETDKARYHARQVLFAAGPWMPQLLPELDSWLQVYRQVLYWFAPDGPAERFSPEHMPVYIRLAGDGKDMFYGFPALAEHGGLKVATEQYQDSCRPDELQRDVSENEIAGMFARASSGLRIRNRCLKALTCQYTVTDDFHFLIDRLPDSERVWIASPCSGHGFKHSAAIGECLAELMISGASRIDLGRFAWRPSGARFAPDRR